MDELGAHDAGHGATYQTATVVVSLRSRGLSSYDLSKFNIPKHAISLGTACLDIFLCFLLTFYELSWSAWVSLFISILAAAISTSNAWLDQRPHQEAAGDTILIRTGGATASAFVLPLLILTSMPVIGLVIAVFWRRCAKQAGPLFLLHGAVCSYVAHARSCTHGHCMVRS